MCVCVWGGGGGVGQDHAVIIDKWKKEIAGQIQNC